MKVLGAMRRGPGVHAHGHIAGYSVTCNHGSGAFGRPARGTDGTWRIYAQAFGETGLHIRQSIGRCDKGDVLFAVESIPHLVGRPAQGLAVLQQIVRRPRERRRRGLSPRQQEEVGVGLDFAIAQRDSARARLLRLLQIALQHVRDEVGPLTSDALGKPLLGPASHEFQVAPTCILEASRRQSAQQLRKGRVRRHGHGAHERAQFDRVPKPVHPLVVLAAPETAERLPDGEIADDVKRREVVPFYEIRLRSRVRSPLTQPLDQQVDVNLDSRLLGAESPL